MSRFHRIMIVLAILLSGLAFIPYVGFAREEVNWQRFANAYQEEHKLFLPVIIR